MGLPRVHPTCPKQPAMLCVPTRVSLVSCCIGCACVATRCRESKLNPQRVDEAIKASCSATIGSYQVGLLAY